MGVSRLNSLRVFSPADSLEATSDCVRYRSAASAFQLACSRLTPKEKGRPMPQKGQTSGNRAAAARAAATVTTLVGLVALAGWIANVRRTTLISLLVTLALASAVFIVLFRAIHREMRARRGAEQALRDSEQYNR